MITRIVATLLPTRRCIMATPTIAALVCDLDGVVRHFGKNAQARAEDTYGLDPGTIARIALDPRHLNPAVSGRVSDEDWRARVTVELAALIGESDARDAMGVWSGDIGTVDAAVLDLVRQARQHCPVVIFSNATSRLHQDLARLGLLSEVDAIVNSAETGYPKPQRAAFVAADAAVQRALGHRPRRREILFTDDDHQNVVAGALHGWTTSRFVGALDLAELLGATDSSRNYTCPKVAAVTVSSRRASSCQRVTARRAPPETRSRF